MGRVGSQPPSWEAGGFHRRHKPIGILQIPCLHVMLKRRIYFGKIQQT